jgi:hypothetical protein
MNISSVELDVLKLHNNELLTLICCYIRIRIQNYSGFMATLQEREILLTKHIFSKLYYNTKSLA